MLEFFGRGSAFADEHNSAFFYDGTDMILLDCSMDSFQKIKKMDLSNVEHIYILITHTHGDHIAGLGMVVDYEFFVGKIPVTIVAPSEEVKTDLYHSLSVMEGCSDDWYELITSSELDKDFLTCSVPTKHTLTLDGKCFGYNLTVDGRNVVYTGDTATLDTFIPYLKSGSILYTEVSAYKTGVHLYAEDIKDIICSLTADGTEVYLMHMDEEDQILDILKDTGAKPAPLYS